MRMGLLDAVKPFNNLYHIARTDLDIATLAGIVSAEAIISGDRAEFDLHFDPSPSLIGPCGLDIDFSEPGCAGTYQMLRVDILADGVYQINAYRAKHQL